MSTKTVVIATPDSAQRERLGQLVNDLPGFEVICGTADLMNTYTVVEERLPKAVLIADTLANLPEFEVMHALFSTLDIRWLVITAHSRSARRSQNPAIIGVPGSDLFSIPGDAPEEVYVRQLSALTRTDRSFRPAAKTSAPQPSPDNVPPLTRSPVLTTRSGIAKPATATKSAPANNRTAIPTVSCPRNSKRVSTNLLSSVPPLSPSFKTTGKPTHQTDRLILIGSSTGGVDALLSVLTRFPEDCPPTLVVQHTGAGFGASLAALLNRQCRAKVSLASGHDHLRRGEILIGAGTRSHLVIDGRAGARAATILDAPVAGHVPSVDTLFHSAVPLARRVAAALLTGMGRDGADGMKALYNAGALTIAQNEATCVVYGMPRAAIESGCVHRVLPLDRIAEALLTGHATAPLASRELQK